MSLKGRLPNKLLSEFTFSCKIVQIHILYCRCFINKQEKKKTEIETYCVLMCKISIKHFFKIFKDFCSYLIANVFRRSTHTKKKTRLFSIFSAFIFCPVIYLFEKRKLKLRKLILAYPQRVVLSYSSSLLKAYFQLHV